MLIFTADGQPNRSWGNCRSAVYWVSRRPSTSGAVVGHNQVAPDHRHQRRVALRPRRVPAAAPDSRRLEHGHDHYVPQGGTSRYVFDLVTMMRADVGQPDLADPRGQPQHDRTQLDTAREQQRNKRPPHPA